MTRRQQDPQRHVAPPGFGRAGTRALELAENVVYGGIAVLLVVAALVLLLGLIAWLLRRKEREPDEGDGAGGAGASRRVWNG